MITKGDFFGRKKFINPSTSELLIRGGGYFNTFVRITLLFVRISILFARILIFGARILILFVTISQKSLLWPGLQ